VLTDPEGRVRITLDAGGKHGYARICLFALQFGEDANAGWGHPANSLRTPGGVCRRHEPAASSLRLPANSLEITVNNKAAASRRTAKTATLQIVHFGQIGQFGRMIGILSNLNNLSNLN
jgi:hypothetical protein